MNEAWVAFETDRFENDQPDDEIGHWFLGGDVATWLHDSLTRDADVESNCGPVEEDWGWYFAVRTANTTFEFGVQNVRTWIVGLNVRRGWFRTPHGPAVDRAFATLRQRVSALLNTPEFRDVGWYDDFPFDRCR